MSLSVKAVRANAGLNQEEFAEKIGMPVSTYRLKEQGKSPWLFEEICKICDVFNVDINLLTSNTLYKNQCS